MKQSTSLVRILIVALLLLWGGAACGGEEVTPTATAVAQIVETPTETAVPPTDTPAPTDTPMPTETPAPTDTATPTETPLPTDTPEPTATPTEVPTETPEPTNTAVPATNTPAAPAATATPEATEESGEPEMITVYYISNPNDILGVFPERPFDAAALTANMNNIYNSLQTMRGNIDGAKAGDATACSTYVGAYNNILYSGVFYKDVPGDWEEIDFVYFLSFIYSLDRTRPAYLSCINVGKVDDFNYGLALTAIDQTVNFMTPSLNAANSR